ncbi:peptidoglycan editing factor PgeF [Aestuariimicrobium ganziense]|uniref:peptidoglycan editing factor PgeF n=1 Tax=Aestuariimicrobium ganziense TaxID=2773677 RepID=UPI0019414C2F|nr:peptidoglycan editing factor PgeF [Aestuariimicrobium ganziense]
MFRILIGPDANHGVGAAFTDRHGGVSSGTHGSLNLGRTDLDDLAAVETNFERVRRAIGVARVVTLDQVHGDQVVVVDQRWMHGWGPLSHLGGAAGQPPLVSADAMVTTLPDVALCIRVADCVPVLLCDTSAGVIGAAHAGRAGFLSDVAGRTVEQMRDLGARDIVAWLGPHICASCYEVPQSMADEVAQSHRYAVSTTTWGTPSIDLAGGLEHQLLQRGVEVVRLDPCTRTEPSLHSHRRDGADAGRLGGLIWRVSGAA